MKRWIILLASAVAFLASCGEDSQGDGVGVDAILDTLVSASVCELQLLEGVVELGGRPPLAESEPLFSPVYVAAIFDTGDVRATADEPVNPGRVSQRLAPSETTSGQSALSMTVPRGAWTSTACV